MSLLIPIMGGGKYYPKHLGMNASNQNKNIDNPSDSIIFNCHYHLCNKENIQVFRCKYCNDYFCRDHVKPKAPAAAPFKTNDIKKQNDWQDKDGHPCPLYMDYLQEKKHEGKIENSFFKPNITPNILRSTDNSKDEIDLFFEKETNDNNSRNQTNNKINNSTNAEFQSNKKQSISKYKKKKTNTNDRNQHRTKKSHKKRSQYSMKSKIKYRWNNIVNKIKRRFRGTVHLPAGLILGLFLPLIVGILVIYLLEPGIAQSFQYLGTQNTLQLILLFLLIPADVYSYIPWIAWIAAGVTAGWISNKILIPFLSMYGLVWLCLYLFNGDLFISQFSLFFTYGLNQIILQFIVKNIIFAILAFGFGGWIGLMFSSGKQIRYVKKTTMIGGVSVGIFVIFLILFSIGIVPFIDLGGLIVHNDVEISDLSVKTEWGSSWDHVTKDGFYHGFPDDTSVYYHITGSIRNIANKPIDSVTITANYYDAQNNLLDSSFTQVFDLYLNQTKNFNIKASNQGYSYDYCEYFKHVDHYDIEYSIEFH